VAAASSRWRRRGKLSDVLSLIAGRVGDLLDSGGGGEGSAGASSKVGALRAPALYSP
jgi:hypothetical protein